MPEPRKCPECGAELPGDSTGGLCVACGLRAALQSPADPSPPLPDQTVKETNDAKVEPASEKTGDRIGRYKLLQEIGVGGMGSVWMAEQQQPHRRVALKLVKLGMDTKQVLARFSAEQQALALMDHPNIAKVFEAGSTDNGRPYFVMELVRGIPITTYCDREKLSTGERLELFMQVCQAIQHAHQKGVIHRDIKPSNILVTRLDGVPVPKVIDFGIAKATQGKLVNETLFTAFDQFIGTPAYMSPEQAELNALDIDTRSDIYSLGVLLYELLSGQTPFDAKKLLAAGLDEIRRVIREEEPPKPSTRLTEELVAADARRLHSKSEIRNPKSEIDRDLDWIVMKCLEKDRSRRYETASGLAADLQRHLHNEPVVACPPSTLYRFQKLVRRNKLAFGLGSAVAASLGIGLVALAMLFLREKEASRTQTRLRNAAERASTETKMTLAASDFSQAVRLIEEGHRSDALAYLVRSLRANPTNDAALTRIATLLTSHSWTVATLVLRHSSVVNQAEFSPDGKRIVTTARDSGARIWDAQTGELATELLKHIGSVYSVRFSPDSKRIITGSADGTARVWDAQSGRPLTEPLQHGTNGVSAQFSPNGKQILTIANDRSRSNYTAQLWDALSGQPLAKPLRHKSVVGEARFSPDGQQIVTVVTDWWLRKDDNSAACVWDVQSGELRTEPLKHDGPVITAEFSPDGRRIVTASRNGVRVWDAQTGKLLAGIEAAESARFSPDGKRIVTRSNNTARLWDALTGQPLTEPLKDSNQVYSAEFSPDGRRIVTCGGDYWKGLARVWDAQTGQPLTEPLKHYGAVLSAKFSPDGKRIITGSRDGAVRVWETQGWQPLTEPLKHAFSWRPAAQFSPDGMRIVTASADGTARVWDAQTGRQLTEPLKHGTNVVSAQFSPDGMRIATTASDRTTRVWDAQTGQPLPDPLKHSSSVVFAQFSPDWKRIITASADNTATVWDAQTGQPLTEPLKHSNRVYAAQFSPDGMRIVTASAYNWVWGTNFAVPRAVTTKSDAPQAELRVWDAQTGRPLTEPLKFNALVSIFEFSPDGRRIVTALSSAIDYTARVWDAQTGQPLADPLKHTMPVQSVQFSPDGKRIVTTSYQIGARVWDADSGKPLTEYLIGASEWTRALFSADGKRIVTPTGVWDACTGLPLTESLKDKGEACLQFSPDGKRVITTSAGRAFRIWDVPSAAPRCPDWLLQLAEAISGQVVNKQGVLEETKLNRAEVIKQVREKLSHEPDDDDRVVWGRWFLADPSSRTISPFSKLTVPEYIENRIKENTADSLAEAEQLAFGKAELLTRISQARSSLEKTRPIIQPVPLPRQSTPGIPPRTLRTNSQTAIPRSK